MKRSDFVRTALFTGLIASSVFLTIQLWFGTFSNRNFFYAFLSAFNLDEDDKSWNSEILKPEKILVGSGNGYYASIVDDMDASAQKAVCDKALTALLKNGDFIEESEIDWNVILSGKTVVYSYPFSITSELFVGNIKNRSLSTRFEAFDAIILTPRRDDGAISIWFANDSEAYEYELNNAELCEEMLNSHISAKGIFYVSSVQHGLGMFEKNAFVPQWTGDNYEYSVISMENPYAPQGDINIATIKSKTEYLFTEPGEQFSGVLDGLYTVSDETVVVRYNPDDTLEYSNYSKGKEPSGSIAADYRAASAFLRKDSAITNSYYLSRAESSETGHTFYFNYAINGFSINWPETFAAETNMSAPLQITVSNGKVSKFKKLVYNFYVNDEYAETANVSFIDSFENILSEGAQFDGSGIAKLSLGYRMENSKNLRLYWFMDLNGASYARTTRFK
ncbi:MAG: two-component system activity regulator YycH [Clostridiales bacterium]|jgi:regulatory protein YycH of two-component signal transduction system YycFG|nr:two-component system activity regulator YycH [Clostridiales bacterium]